MQLRHRATAKPSRGVVDNCYSYWKVGAQANWPDQQNKTKKEVIGTTHDKSKV